MEKKRFRQSRAFIFALVAVTVVWFVASMSETNKYREQYAIAFDGLDTARYAITAVDSVITVDITSNGFHALNRSISKPRTIHFDILQHISRLSQDDEVNKSNTVTVSIKDSLDIIARQIDMRGIDELQTVTEKATISYAPREWKVYHPDIESVEFEFDGMAGLCGEPRIVPDSVIVYGSRQSLDKLDKLKASHQVIKHIRKSGNYSITLEPSWKKFPDLRLSTEKVKIFIPVETFIEKKIMVPVEYKSNDNVKRVELYPSTVTVNCLLPRSNYSDIKDKDLVVSAIHDGDSGSTLRPVVTQFPSNIRIKSVEPQEIQYIVIK